MEMLEAVYKIVTSAGGALTLERPQSAAWSLSYCRLHGQTSNCHKHAVAATDAPGCPDKKHKNRHPHNHTLYGCLDNTRMCRRAHMCASSWKPTLLDCFNSFSFDWCKAFLKYHRCSCLQQLHCSLEGEWVAVHHFQQQIEFQWVAWCVFGWWSISRSCIFRLMQVLQVTDWLPV